MSTPESRLQDLLDELSQLRAQNAMLKEKHFGSQKYEPLSESEIAAIWDDSDKTDVAITRAIEKAHGIGGGK